MPNALDVPKARGEVSCFRELKPWQAADVREQSLARDLWATAQLCELLGVCSFDDALGFRESFNALADLGYAGYCFYDFASVSKQGILDVFEALLREQLGDPTFEALRIWDWAPDSDLRKLLPDMCLEQAFSFDY
jgi:hypothetical protein